MDIINNIKKIIPIFLLSIIIFTIPVSARWAYVNPVETITISNANTTKERCLHYARKIMGHNAIFASSNLEQEVWLKTGTTNQKYKKWIDIIFDEISNGRPIILSAKKRNTNQVYHWVLAYQFGIYSGNKEYQTLTIIDPVTNTRTSANNYQFQYRYIKIKASHLWDEGKRRNEIVNFAKKFTNNGGYRSKDIYNHVCRVYGNNSKWATNNTFGNGEDWCCYFVNFVYNRCGMDPYAIKYERFAVACTDDLMYQAQRNYKFRYKKQYTPQKGDIIFFDYIREKTGYRRDKIADHVGIVESVRNGIVCTIEGNTGNDNASYSKVKAKWYYLNDADILGYLNPYA